MDGAGADDDEAPCAYCSVQRALLHCAQHRARLCLPCDLRVHAAAAPAHERAPLCDACHAAPAAALCGDHQASLCAPCARAAGCDAGRHATRPARAYTGVPAVEELARILSGDTTPPPPPSAAALPEPADTSWIPDLINIELLPDLTSTSSWRDGNASTELLPGSLIETGGSFEGQIAGSSAAALPPTGDGDELFMQQDWPNLSDAGLDDFNFFIAQDSNLTNSFNSMGHREGALEASPPLGYDHPLIASCSEPIIASTDAVLESLASNNAAYHQQQFSSVLTASSSNNNVGFSSELHPRGNMFYASRGGMPMLPRRDELPSRHLGLEVKPYQDQDAVALQASSIMAEQPSSQGMEARTKQQEKRQEAKQRYKDKKKNRRFGKQIMYVSRKVRADTRNRVKGRFAKASSSSWHASGDQQSTQHGDDQPTNS
ncbi:hypothetical protein SETIT_1G006700v2 [Setaria italica]|uniref:CCT domain-containing protein n=1 Tax=Setaria italica TaxID=4555 RepID=A0A368PFD2_SETIT|nr:hypothetical protein SETIT_1G006700v2 [Setaria italica]